MATGNGRMTRRRLVAAGAATATMTAAGAIIPARYAGRVYPGVTVLGRDVGGLSRQDAIAAVRSDIETYCEQLVTFDLDGRQWLAGAKDLGIVVEWDRLAEAILDHGRDGALRRFSALMPWHGATAIPLPVLLDDVVLEDYLDQLDTDISLAPVNATLEGVGAQTIVAPDVDGRQLDRDRARVIVEDVARTLTRVTVPMPFVVLPADVPASMVKRVQERIVRLTAEPITVRFDNQSWEITADELTRGLVVPDDPLAEDAWLDPWWIDRLVDPIITALWVPPVDAVLAWDSGLYALSPSTPGQQVSRSDLVSEVIAVAERDERTVDVPAEQVLPRVDSNDLAALGITGLVIQGDSSFAGSSPERDENVRVASYWVSQTAIAPGETFSFNDSLGPITVERGYVVGKIILGDWYTSDLGGGVCQVSTTVYRAALLAGLPFAEWHPHTARVGFYELDGWSAGVDAAIYQANTPDQWPLDLAFVNTTDAWLLLQLRVWDGTLIADLYGAPTDWTVDLAGPVLGEPIQPPAPVERASADLAPGERRLSQSAQPGVVATLQRKVTANGHVLRDDTFVSTYQPLPEVTLVGG